MTMRLDRYILNFKDFLNRYFQIKDQIYYDEIFCNYACYNKQMIIKYVDDNLESGTEIYLDLVDELLATRFIKLEFVLDRGYVYVIVNLNIAINSPDMLIGTANVMKKEKNIIFDGIKTEIKDFYNKYEKTFIIGDCTIYLHENLLRLKYKSLDINGNIMFVYENIRITKFNRSIIEKAFQDFYLLISLKKI